MTIIKRQSVKKTKVCDMHLWGVAILESHPDRNKGQEDVPYACPKTHPEGPRS